MKVHIGKTHKEKEVNKKEIEKYRTGNGPEDFTMKVFKSEPFECITVSRDITEGLKTKLENGEELITAIVLHSKSCWLMSAESLPCPDRPECPLDEPPHAGNPLVDEDVAHLLLEPDHVQSANSDYPHFAWFSFEELYYTMDHNIM